MLRFVFVILVSLPFIIYYMCLSEHIEKNAKKYSEDDRYAVVQKIISCMKRNGFIETKVYGTENLPDEGGYIMYSNHQGKYDALGIIYGHEKACTVMMDKKRSKMLIVNQFMQLIKGCRIDKTSLQTQVRAIKQVTDEVKSGRRYIIFPEGGYYHNKNMVQEFLPGSFKCAIRSKAPIVPVAIIDSYKPFEINSLKKVTTQVHYLPAIEYSQYQSMSSNEIASYVRTQIVDKIDTVLNNRQST